MPTTHHTYMETANLFLSRLSKAETTGEVQKALEGMEKMAAEENADPAAKTILGLGYLMEDKPWYDFKRGFEAVKDAAESDEPFCWFILGSLYLNGKPELPKDPVSAKYWIDKAADAGYKDAVVIQELKWGDNPEGFVGWLAERLEKEAKWRRWIGIGLIALVVIAAIVILFV